MSPRPPTLHPSPEGLGVACEIPPTPPSTRIEISLAWRSAHGRPQGFHGRGHDDRSSFAFRWPDKTTYTAFFVAFRPSMAGPLQDQGGAFLQYPRASSMGSLVVLVSPSCPSRTSCPSNPNGPSSRRATYRTGGTSSTRSSTAAKSFLVVRVLTA